MKFLATILFFIIVLSNSIANGLNNSDIEVCLSYLRNSALRAHNNYRVKHSSPALNLDNNINNIALNYANKLISTFSFDHNPELGKLGYGENLYQSMSSDKIDFTPTKCEEFGNDAVNAWYNEIKSYDFKTGKSKDGGEIGHFTQLVWKGSSMVGVGFATAYNNNDQMYYVIVVADYSPAGNVEENYSENVIPAA